MRIAQIAPPWFPVPPPGYGGIEAVVSLLADGLAAQGHEVTLFASGGSRSDARLVSPLPQAPEPARLGDTWEETYHAVSAYLHAGEFDVLHDHSGIIGSALGALLPGPPVVHTLHGPWTELARRHYQLLGDRIHLVAISEAQRRLGEGVPVRWVVPNGVNLDDYPLVEEKEDFLLFLGRSNPDKGPEIAVEVAHRSGLPLKMVVKRSERFEREYWDRVVVPRLRGDEEILENVSQAVKADLLGRARATIFSIQWPEPFGLVMVESMACGTPVLATSLGAAPEIVVDSVTGFLCEGLDEMVAALERIGEIDPATCRAHVAERFGAKAMVTGYERVFEAVTSATAPGARAASCR